MSKPLLGLSVILVTGAVFVACSSTSTTNNVAAETDGGGDGDTPMWDGGEPDAASADAGFPANTWTWIDVPGAKCRDGSSTGIGVNLSPGSTKTVMFLEGGGACFNSATCGQNPSKFSGADFKAYVGMGGPAGSGGGKSGTSFGILARADMKNPVKDWNMIYVPYCTGDIHGGNNLAGMVAGVSGTQQFVGRNNVKLALEQTKTLVPSTDKVLLTGASGGGFGALMAYDQVATFWGSVPVTMIDDSGPPMADPFLPSCMQTLVASLWGLDKSVLADCGPDCQGDGGAIDTAHWGINAVKHLAKKYPDRVLGLVESTGDLTISSFFGFGASNCTAFQPVLEPDFTSGLLDIRAQLAFDKNFGTFYFGGADHQAHTSYENALDTRMSTDAMDGGAPISLADWTTQMVNGTVTNVGP